MHAYMQHMYTYTIRHRQAEYTCTRNTRADAYIQYQELEHTLNANNLAGENNIEWICMRVVGSDGCSAKTHRHLR